MKRPDNLEQIGAVQLARRGQTWYPVVKTMTPGVRVVVEGATHWFLWDKVRAIKEER